MRCTGDSVRERADIDDPFVAGCSINTYYHNFGQLSVSALTASLWWNSVLWLRLRVAQIYNIKEKYYLFAQMYGLIYICLLCIIWLYQYNIYRRVSQIYGYIWREWERDMESNLTVGPLCNITSDKQWWVLENFLLYMFLLLPDE